MLLSTVVAVNPPAHPLRIQPPLPKNFRGTAKSGVFSFVPKKSCDNIDMNNEVDGSDPHLAIHPVAPSNKGVMSFAAR